MNKMNDIYLRKADYRDLDLLFIWANDETVRENAFNTQMIKFEEHVQWFKEKIISDRCMIYIYCQGDTPIGQGRIDIDGAEGIISYSIDKSYRFRGHGRILLELLEAAVDSDLPAVEVLVAKVKKANIASQRKFDQRLYDKTEKDDYFEYRKSKGTDYALHPS